MRFRVLLHRSADIGDPVSHAGIFQCFKETLTSYVDKILCLLRDLPAVESSGTVSDKPFKCCTNIDGDDIAILDFPFTRNAVNDLLIDRDAGTGRKSAITKESRYCSTLSNEIMNLPVYLACGNTCGDSLPSNGTSLGGNLAGSPHVFDIAGRLYDDRFSHFRFPELPLPLP